MLISGQKVQLLIATAFSLLQSCVNVILDFISPENATQCVQLNEEIRLLPMRHKAKSKMMEVGTKHTMLLVHFCHLCGGQFSLGNGFYRWRKWLSRELVQRLKTYPTSCLQRK